MSPQALEPALRLRGHLSERHEQNGALIGPDYGVRLNYRLGRFVKSYLRALPWRDHLYYLQAQGYWTLANWSLASLTGDERFGATALECSREMLRRQLPDGSWLYPHPGWKGRIATAEGSWAAIGLLASHAHSGDQQFLAGALRWHAFLEQHIGWQRANDGLAVNYFGDRSGSAVPNNSVLVLRLLAALATATGDEGHLARAPQVLAFLGSAQQPSGELPYSVGEGGRPHFQCYQYNAFQALDLTAYIELSGDEGARAIVTGLARFIRAGLRPDGSLPYACHEPYPEVPYHLAAAAAALRAIASLESGGGGREDSERAYRRLLSHQAPNGGFPHSLRDYRLLSDRRSYPRSQAMILNHLLLGAAD
ncbi:MAG TPA: hypothetical protein VIM03_02970 [Thermoleophilaceae bacterium]|jgi:hypothetical protein